MGEESSASFATHWGLGDFEPNWSNLEMFFFLNIFILFYNYFFTVHD